MRKAYIARFEIETLFTADDTEDDIAKVALEAVTQHISDTHIGPLDIDYEVADCMPLGWSHECPCYGSHQGEILAGDALDATPEYAEKLRRMMRLAKRIVKE